MGVSGDLLLTLVGVAIVVFARLEVAFGGLIAFWLLVPGLLIVPHAPHILLVDRAVLYAFACRLLFRRGNGEPGVAAYAPTPVHAALGVLLVVAFANGVVLAPTSVSLASDLDQWLGVLDLVVLLVVVTAVVRTLPRWLPVSIIGVALTIAALLGFWERAFHHGWSHFFFEGLPQSYLAPSAAVLSTRGTNVRSQVAGQFALEYGWVLAMLLPLGMVAALRWARGRWVGARLALAVPVVIAVAVVFSGSRSAELAAGIAIVLVAAVAGANRVLIASSVAAAAIAVLVVAVNPTFLTSSFSTAGDPAAIRLDRLPTLFGLVVHRPFTGLGLNGISSVFTGIDNGYALIYATLGVMGVLAWITVIATALVSAGRSLRAPRGSDTRMLGAAAIIGVIGVAVATSSYDLPSTPQSAWALVFLAAIGASVGESIPVYARPPRNLRARLLLPLGGLAIGFAVLLATPASASETFSLFAVAPWVSATQGTGSGTDLVNTLCPGLTNPNVVAQGATVHCLRATDIQANDYPGLAIVTVRAKDPAAVRNAVHNALVPFVFYFHKSLAGGPTGIIQTGKPAWATTAPLSGGWLGAWAMLLLPATGRRRKIPAHVRPSPKATLVPV